jgi:hypothetical protein
MIGGRAVRGRQRESRGGGGGRQDGGPEKGGGQSGGNDGLAQFIGYHGLLEFHIPFYENRD